MATLISTSGAGKHISMEEVSIMHTQLTNRLAQLRAEHEAGQQMLADLEAKQRNLRDTLLRISGAIQVLEEELARAEPPADVVASADGIAQPVS